jgi:hypothetical protein
LILGLPISTDLISSILALPDSSQAKKQVKMLIGKANKLERHK